MIWECFLPQKQADSVDHENRVEHRELNWCLSNCPRSYLTVVLWTSSGIFQRHPVILAQIVLGEPCVNSKWIQPSHGRPRCSVNTNISQCSINLRAMFVSVTPQQSQIYGWNWRSAPRTPSLAPRQVKDPCPPSSVHLSKRATSFLISTSWLVKFHADQD